VFFGSARIAESGPLGRYYTEARELAAQVTQWSRQLFPDGSRLVVCSGGGGGIMEAANRGAKDAGGRTIGLNIGLPHEQRPNSYLDPDLAFEFHYFFMRKLWFAHLARAAIVFPGGFGTLDEMFELLMLRQTRKLDRDICILLYGSAAPRLQWAPRVLRRPVEVAGSTVASTRVVRRHRRDRRTPAANPPRRAPDTPDRESVGCGRLERARLLAFRELESSQQH
jgi:uncharacterized protein (TIGR00730 family)